MQAVKNFRTNLRKIMEFRSISQREMADMSNLSYPYISRILMARVDPSLPICDQIADSLEVPLTHLLAKPSEFREALLTAGVSR